MPTTLDVMKMAVADKVRVHARGYIAMHGLDFVLNHAEVAVRIEDMAHHLAVELSSFVLGQVEKRIDLERAWPANWWEAFKLDVLSKWRLTRWWVRRHPVRREILSIHETCWRVCPHLNIKTHPDARHYAFLAGSSDVLPR